MARYLSASAGYGLSNPRVSHHLLESMPGPSLLCDEQDNVRGWNQRALSALGLSAPHLYGRRLPEIFRGAQSEAFSRELGRARSQGMGEVTLPFQVPGGPIPRFTFRLLGLSDSHGKWVIVTATLAHATDEEDGSARTLLNQHPYGLLVLHTYRVTFANPVSGELLGFSDANALTGLPLSSLVYDPDRPQMGQLLDKALRQKDAQDRLRLRDSQGGPLDMEVCLSLLEGEKQPAIQVVFRPISRHQGIEQALRKHEERQWMLLNRALGRSEERTREALQRVLEEQGLTAANNGDPGETDRLRSLLDTLFEGIWEGDAEGRTHRLNLAMLGMLGRPREEMIDRSLTELLPPEERPRLGTLLKTPGNGEVLETRLCHRDGREVPVGCRVAALTASGREDPERTLLFSDLSTRQALPQRLQRGPREGDDRQRQGPEEWVTEPEGFLFMLRREIARSHRHGTPLSLLAVGIAELAQIRERYGPRTAREVVGTFESLIRTHSRATDLLMHIEGPLFFLLAPETSAEGARGLEQKLERLIHRHDFDPVAWIHPETGSATYQKGEGPEDLILRAQESVSPGLDPDSEAGKGFDPLEVIGLR